jgi:hypothetical protein
MVRLSVIKLINTEDSAHEQEKIYSAEFDFYPAYQDGQIIYLEHVTSFAEPERMKLTAFKIIDVVHMIRKYTTRSNNKTHASLELYVREIE